MFVRVFFFKGDSHEYVTEGRHKQYTVFFFFTFCNLVLRLFLQVERTLRTRLHFLITVCTGSCTRFCATESEYFTALFFLSLVINHGLLYKFTVSCNFNPIYTR